MTRPSARSGDEGYLLLGLVIACFLLLLTLSIAAPRVAKELERDREIESEHRAQQYVRAIQQFYLRTHRFPTSVDELLGKGASGATSALTVHYLRQQYKDPLTGGDYRLILVGKAKTEVKGFFGEPLEGAPVGLGSVAGIASTPGTASGFGGTTAGAPFGGTGSSLSATSATSSSTAGTTGVGTAASPSGTPSSPAGGTTAAQPDPAASAGTPAASAGTPASSGGSTFGASASGTSATTFQGSKGMFLGVASNAKGHGLVEWNGSENIEDWEFLYDPRVELLKARVSLFGGSSAAGGSMAGPGAAGAGSSLFAPQQPSTASPFSGLNVTGTAGNGTSTGLASPSGGTQGGAGTTAKP